MSRANVVKFVRERGGALKLDRSYNFVEKRAEVDELRTLIEDEGLKIGKVAERSGVTRNTINRWLNGKTQRPQVPTLNAVGRVFGKRLAWVDIK